MSCLEEMEQDRRERVPERAAEWEWVRARGGAAWVDSALAPEEAVCARTAERKCLINAARRAQSSNARAAAPQ